MTLSFTDYVELTESMDSPYEMHHIPDRYVENSDKTIAGHFPENEPSLGLSNRKLYGIGMLVM